MLFDGKLDEVDLMAIDYQEKQDRKEKLKIVVQWIKNQKVALRLLLIFLNLL